LLDRRNFLKKGLFLQTCRESCCEFFIFMHEYEFCK
jgi:hypothetical protein